jgi:murein DD-endopeptidase MepM/ murein hydrolase activator NlpD
MTRMHPVLNKVMPHTGTDFGAPSGTPIGSTAPGTVSYKGYAGPSGNLVKIKHHDGYESGYAHLSRFAEGLDVGDEVDRLKTVGYCGSTGRSTGPHLHFTMKKDGKFIDPESLNLDGMRVLPKAHREEFALVRSKYDPVLDAIPLPEPLPVTAAPTAQPVADPGGDEVEGTEDEGEGESYGMMEDESSQPPSPSAAVRPPPQAPSKPAQAQKPSAIFLSDSDLLKMQSSTDDGEVHE